MIEIAAARALRVAALHERVLLVEAGPGWGKTTAVRAAFPEALYVEVPHGDRLGALHAAILMAYGLSAADAGRVASRLEDDPAFAHETVASAIPLRATLIVDDVQRLNPDGVALVETIAERSGIHLVCVGRSMAALPVSTWLARGRAGMPIGLDMLTFSVGDVAEILGDAGRDGLPGAIVAAFGGWPIAALLARSLLLRGVPDDQIVRRLREGVASVAASVLSDVKKPERALLIEAALMTTYGVRASPGHVALLRRLGFPESAYGPHEIIASALLEEVDPIERSAAACSIAVDAEQLAPLFSLLANEAPEALATHAWTFLPWLYDRYDAATLKRFAEEASIEAVAVDVARCFVLALSSDYAQAAAIAERLIAAAGEHSTATALRLARVMLIGGRGAPAGQAVRDLDASDPIDVVWKACILGTVDDRRELLSTAMEAASQAGNLSLMAIAAVFAAYRAVRAGELDDADGFAARAEEAARASGSPFQQARALKIRYVVAMLRADLDVAAVHVGRLTTLQAYVSDPSQRASDLVSALEVEVFAGRAARAAAFDEAIRRAGHGWLDMETYVVCRAFMDAWDGHLLEAADRLAASHSLLNAAGFSRLPVALAAFFALCANQKARSDQLLELLSNHPHSDDLFLRAHDEMARSYVAMTHALAGRPTAAARALKAHSHSGFGALFLKAARTFAGSGDFQAYAQVMRDAGFEGVARAISRCALTAPQTALSTAERQVLEYLASGLNASAIAELTGRSVHTIRNQRRSIVDKLGATNLLEAMAIARRRGLLQN